MKKLLCVLLILPLSGCFWQEVSGLEVSAVAEGCKKHGGIRRVISYANGNVEGVCGNGNIVEPIYVKAYIYQETPIFTSPPTGG